MIRRRSLVGLTAPGYAALALAWVMVGLAVQPTQAAGTGKKQPGQKAPGPDFFGPATVHVFHLAIPADEYAAMQPRGGWGGPNFGAVKLRPPERPEGSVRPVHRNTFGVDLPWAKGSVTVDRETFQDVGIRYKGNGTIGDASQTIKKSFKIALDHFGGTARLQGLKTINLHCGVTDPSKCRETLAYGLYRAAGVPASRTALAEVRLTVPGKYDRELLGLYTVVEQVDKPFLRAHFGTDRGLLMKPEGLREFEYQGDDWTRYRKQYVPKREPTKEEVRRVLAFARLVHKADDDEFRKEIGSYLDIDAYLRFLAATAFVANSDSFFVLGHNYYLYLHPRTGRFHFIPWDLDRAFANFPILGSNSQQMNLSFTHPYAATHRLTERLLAMPGVAEKYQKLLKELAGRCFEKGRLLKELEATEAVVKDLMAREAKAAKARKEGGSGVGPPALFGKPPALRTFMERRTASLAAQLAGKSRGHVPAGGFGPGAFKVGDMLAGPLLEALDADKDGTLSRDEWLAAAKKVFDASEKDAQKRVSEKGVADALNGMFPRPPEGSPPPPPGFGPGNFMAGPIVKRADADKDGKVTRDELVAAAEKLFDEFDKTKAGKLDETAFGEMLNALFPLPNPGPPGGRPGEPKKDDRKEKRP